MSNEISNRRKIPSLNQENRSKSCLKRKTSLYIKMKPICFVEYGNNSDLIVNIVESIGFICKNENIDDFKFKWVQSIQNINWNNFQDGKQLVNHIQGEDYFTNKLQLYQSLQTYQNTSQIHSKSSTFYLSLNQFIPQTFKLDEINDRNLFFNQHQNGDIWICKPSGLNQGRGIYLVRDIEQIKEKYSQKDISLKPMKTILQRYIRNPLLIFGKKFDIRCYMLISNVQPFLIFFHQGYLRLSMFDFNPNDENLLTHLTNQCVQKKDPKYNNCKEDTAWTMQQLNDYINQYHQNIQKDWTIQILPKLIERIMLNVIESIRMRLKRRLGCFGLYGLDFLIDDQFQVWLIEINSNPALTTNTNTLEQVIPPIVKESILLSIECFEKIRHGENIFPLKSLKSFECIYNEYEKKSSLPFIEKKCSSSSTSTFLNGNLSYLNLNEQKKVLSYLLNPNEENQSNFYSRKSRFSIYEKTFQRSKTTIEEEQEDKDKRSQSLKRRKSLRKIQKSHLRKKSPQSILI